MIGLIERRISHVVDDHGEIRVFFDQQRYIGHARDRRQNGHRDSEGIAAFPKRGHERTANPIAGRVSGGADAHAAEALLLDQA